MKAVKPTVEYITELTQKCEKIYEGLFGDFKEDDRFYELAFKNDLQIPREFKVDGLVLSTARNRIETACDHTSVSNARVYVNKKSLFKYSEEEAEMLRKFGTGVLYTTNVESSISPWRVAAKHFWLYGLAVIGIFWDADLWLDKPDQKDGEGKEAYAERIDQWRAERGSKLPIVIEAINPANIMLDPYSKFPTFGIEKHKKLCYSLKQAYPYWTNPKEKKLDQEVDYVRYFDNKYRCELADGVPLLKVRGGVVEHGYGFLPYVPIESGLGNVSYDGDIKKRYVGILRYIKEMLVAESRNFSLRDVVVSRTAMPAVTIEGEHSEEVGEISLAFGVATNLPNNTKLVQQTPQVPPDILNLHLYDMSERIGDPRVLRGQSESGIRAAADRRLAMVEAASQFRYSEEAFPHGVAKVLENCALLQKNVIPDGVRIWSRTPTDEWDMVVDKDKLKEPFTFHVEFAPVSEEDEYRRHDDLLRGLQGGLYTKDYVWKKLPDANPADMEFQEEKDRLKNSPVLNQIIHQYAAGVFVREFSKKYGAEAINLAAGGAPQGGGDVMGRLTTSVPEESPPGSAEELQKDLEKLRSQTPTSATQGRGGGGAPYMTR